MLNRCYLTLVAASAGFGCHAKEAPPAPPTSIEVRDGATVIASVRPGRPCRATIGPIEMIIGGMPLISQLGETRWSGESTPQAGTILSRDGVHVARVYPVDQAELGGVYSPEGVALMRVSAAGNGDSVIVSDPAGRVVRTIVRHGDALAVDRPALAISGTTDLVLAGLLTADELEPEVRMLASCERVLSQRERGT